VSNGKLNESLGTVGMLYVIRKAKSKQLNKSSAKKTGSTVKCWEDEELLVTEENDLDTAGVAQGEVTLLDICVQ
jgi:hypothetical protein